MRAYIEFAIKKFQNKTAYRMDCFMGILDTIFSFVVYCSIYKALYAGRAEIDGISFQMVTTSFMLSLGLSNSYQLNEMLLPDKINYGEISSELLRPVSFRLRLLSENVGESIFNLIFNFTPAVIFAALTYGILPPASLMSLLLMIPSTIMGYIILWEFSFIFQTWDFWLFSVWGIITIKNVFVSVLTGKLLPLWFMPDIVKLIIKFTPFESVYFIPTRLYLGQVSGNQLIICLIQQAIWIIILYIIGDALWRKGTKKLVVQGG